MDFSEIIVAIIIGLVILAINSVGSKKQQSSKNQPGRQPGRTIFPEASTQAPQREEQEESRDASTPLTLDEIFAELRRAHEEEERKAHEADEYIPRAPRRAQPQPSRRPQVQPLERREPQTEWRPQPRPAEQPAATVPKPEPAATILTPEEEGKSALARPQTSARPVTQTVPVQESEAETESIDISDIDWRKAVIAAEILNRKY
ncbi:hypothetical protein B5F38_03440 [Barnesiella sp. An22]|nr:hypothetical protein B5F38_03440 [Barnesiella sp. An22]